LVDLAGGSVAEIPTPLDGRSLVPLASGRTETARRVVAEYAAEGSIAPMVMLRAGPLKYIHCEADPPLLFDLLNDPREEVNQATDPRYADLVRRFAAAVTDGWNLQAFNADVLASQARRRIVYEALRDGSYYPWDFQPLQKASERYMRNHMDLNVLEATSRFPPPAD
jgi:choline-sulfatase